MSDEEKIAGKLDSISDNRSTYYTYMVMVLQASQLCSAVALGEEQKAIC